MHLGPSGRSSGCSSTREDRPRRETRSQLALSASAYRTLGDKAGYVRQRGFDPIQHEQMVLKYVEMHGRITRREAAELCQLSPDQAYRLLGRLTGDAHLTRHGSKKGAWYERHG